MKKIISMLAICFFVSSFIGLSGIKSIARAEEEESVYTESEESSAEQTHEGTQNPDTQEQTTPEETMGEDFRQDPTTQEAAPDYGEDW